MYGHYCETYPRVGDSGFCVCCDRTPESCICGDDDE